MMTYTLLTAIAPAALVEQYREAATIWIAGEGMFETPVYDESGLVGFISTGLIDSEVAPLLNDPEAFAAHYGISVGEAAFFRDNFLYLAVGNEASEGGESPLHGIEALNSLALTLSPQAESEANVWQD